MKSTVARGPLLAMIAGGAAISLTGVLVRLANVPPTVSAFWRMAFGGALLTLALIALRQWQRVRWSDALWMVPPALAFAADLFLWHRSIHDVGPGLATLLANLQVFIMALAGVLLHRERLGWRFLTGLALAFGGLWLMVGQAWGGFDSGYRLGVWLGLLTGVCYAGYMLSFRHAQQRRSLLPAAQLLAIMTLLSAGILAVMTMVEDVAFTIPDAHSLLALVALGVVGQCLGWVLISRAMPQLPASLVGLLLLLQPVLAFLLDVLLFHRITRPLEWVGLVLSLCGIFIGSLRSREPVEAPSLAVD
jgi:drug/metabolite transporter (DMT)-like permease